MEQTFEFNIDRRSADGRSHHGVTAKLWVVVDAIGIPPRDFARTSRRGVDWRNISMTAHRGRGFARFAQPTRGTLRSAPPT
jgi:hypothetical protein